MEFAFKPFRLLSELMTPANIAIFYRKQEYIMLKSILLIGFGGFAGSVLRFLISRYTALQWDTFFPSGTLLVNIAGCLMIGIIYGLTFKDAAAPEIRLLLATGFCGGFTTFSSFSFEFLILLRDGHHNLAFLYAGSSMMLGLAAVWIGLFIIKSL